MPGYLLHFFLYKKTEKWNLLEVGHNFLNLSLEDDSI